MKSENKQETQIVYILLCEEERPIRFICTKIELFDSKLYKRARIPCILAKAQILLNCAPKVSYLMATIALLYIIFKVISYTLSHLLFLAFLGRIIIMLQLGMLQPERLIAFPRSHRWGDAGTTPDPVPFAFQTELLL